MATTTSNASRERSAKFVRRNIHRRRAVTGLRECAYVTVALIRALVNCLPGSKARLETPRELELGGIPVTNTNRDEAIDWAMRKAAVGEPTVMHFANAHCINVARDHADYRRVLQRADRVLPDGIGIEIASRLNGWRLLCNLNGTDLFPQLAAAAARESKSIFLLGGYPGVAQEAAQNLLRSQPDIRIAGTHHGYFRDEEEASVIDKINHSGADFLFVAMGVPSQELWIARNEKALLVPVRIGVGGLFDFLANRIPRAPSIIRKLGMEWSWRLIQEPGRMWRRYILGNPRFLFDALRESCSVRVRNARARVERRHAAVQRAESPPSESPGFARVYLHRSGQRLREQGGSAAKRLFDIVCALVLMCCAIPLIVCVAILIRIESPGPIFFKQRRVGKYGQIFDFWKLRSMYVDAEERLERLRGANEMHGGVTFKMKRDPRITRVGRFIRKASIDEVPQLWNVLKGDMSLVGPRPALPREVSEYTLSDRRRLEAKPGITCFWQARGRSDIPFPQQVEMDVDYIYRQSIATDVRVLLETVPAVITARGAY